MQRVQAREFVTADRDRRGAGGVAVVQTTEPPLESVTDVTESERTGIAEVV